MIYLSASTIKDYLLCPRRAWYRRVSPESSNQTKEMSIGSAVHDVLERHWNNEEEALLYAKSVVKKYNIVNDIDGTKVNTFVSNFFDIYPFPSKRFSPNDEIEIYFKLPHTKKIGFTGRIDRISNGIIYDWKTTKRPPQELEKDPQFILYYLAYKQLKGVEPKRVMYVALFGRKEYEFIPIQEHIHYFLTKTVPEVANGIEKNINTRLGRDKKKLCRYCPFRDICSMDEQNGK